MKTTFKHPTKGHVVTVSPSLFNWAAFLVPVIWLLVKRQYGWALGLFLLAAVFKFVPDEILVVAFIVQIGFGFIANRWLAAELLGAGYIEQCPEIEGPRLDEGVALK